MNIKSIDIKSMNIKSIDIKSMNIKSIDIIDIKSIDKLTPRVAQLSSHWFILIACYLVYSNY